MRSVKSASPGQQESLKHSPASRSHVSTHRPQLFVADCVIVAGETSKQQGDLLDTG